VEPCQFVVFDQGAWSEPLAAGEPSEPYGPQRALSEGNAEAAERAERAIKEDGVEPDDHLARLLRSRNKVLRLPQSKLESVTRVALS